MKKGTVINVTPGAFEEATLTSRQEYRIFVKKRKGFIKYALRNEYSLHPLFVFGEPNCYHYIEGMVKFRLLLN